MGAKLVLVCRNPEWAKVAIADIKNESAAGAEIIIGDLASQAAVRQVAAEFKAKHDRLDVILNNAGTIVPSHRMTPDGIEETFAVNHVAYFLLTTLLLDMLKSSAPARIVNVSSEAHRRSKMHLDDLQFERSKYRSFTAYGQSKLCNILFTKELAERLRGTKVTANCLHPGLVASGFGRTHGGFMGLVIRLAHPFMITPEEGAKTQVWLASSPDIDGVSGKYFYKCAERASSKDAEDEADAHKLWEISEGLIRPFRET